MSTPSLAMIPAGVKAGKVYSVLPINGDGDFTFTRASSATRINAEGLIESVLTGVPRLDYTDGGCPSLLLEPAQTQLYGETETMATQTKTVTAVAHTVSFNGTGTITFTGVYAGSLVGTGVNDRVELTFTPTAGSLVSAVSGSVTKSQLVTGSYLGSYIPNTTTGQVTRVADAANGAGDASTFNDSEGVLFAQISSLQSSTETSVLSIKNSATDRIQLFYFNGNEVRINFIKDGGIVFGFINSINPYNLNKIAFKYKANDYALWINGVEVQTNLLANSVLSGLNNLSFDNGVGASLFKGNAKQIQYFNTALTDAELTALTTL
jgi:hypothetical protein